MLNYFDLFKTWFEMPDLYPKDVVRIIDVATESNLSHVISDAEYRTVLHLASLYLERLSSEYGY